ncbi:MAG: hypothetical protein HC882_05480 [Acidobacteria bacterium]|nr:hypothetical protein [Acidobacteriota bacterium]
MTMRTLWIGCVLSHVAFAALGAEGRTPIYEPIEITTQGAYVLTQDVRGTSPVIVIDANEVDLDLNGFRVIGDGPEPVIALSQQDNVRIRGGFVQGAGEGLSVSQGDGVVLADLTVSGSSGTIVDVSQTSAARITRVRVRGQTEYRSLSILGGEAVVVRDLRVESSQSFEAIITSSVDGGRLENAVITGAMDGSGDALYVSNADGSVFSRILVSGSFANGMEIVGSDGTRLVRATVIGSGSGYFGIQSEDVLVGEACFVGNEDGISTIFASRWLVERNLTNANDDGLTFGFGSDDSVTRANVSRGNALNDFGDLGTGNDSAGDNFLPTRQ